MIYIWKDEYPVFLELANLISSELDMPNEITNDLSKEGTWIIFFESFINHRHIFEKRKYIMVQTENILESVRLDSPNLRQEYQNFLRNAYAVWDYTKNFRLGYSKYYQIQYEQSKDMDVFFYGSINPRRKHILDQIPNLSTVSACIMELCSKKQNSLVHKLLRKLKYGRYTPCPAFDKSYIFYSRKNYRPLSQ